MSDRTPKPQYVKLPQKRMGLEMGCAAGIGIGVVLVLLVLLIKSYWPIFLALTLGLIGWRFWRRRQRTVKARKAFLQQTFYQLLQTNRGRITVFDFAVHTNLTGPEAREFLNARAREFYANFEPNDHGDVLYVFPTLSSMTQSAVLNALDQPNQTVD